MPTLICLLLALLLIPAAQAEIRTKTIEYEDDGTPLTGYLYWDDATAGPRPGILVIHEWWGLNDYAKRRARQLAELGYVAFAADMYGHGRVTTDPEQANSWMQEVTADLAWWRQRARLGLEQLKRSELVLTDQVAAIGYCFGGGTVLQMAYGGMPVKGVVSFHGSLPSAPQESHGKISAEILVLHGHADAFTPPERVATFQEALTAADANWEMDLYGGVLHSFTNPRVGDYGIENLRYDAQADARSWQRMQSFFNELFAK